jgi:hypothetical protein
VSSKIIAVLGESKDQKPVKSKDDPLAEFLITRNSDAAHVQRWIENICGGRFKQYAPLFVGENGFQMRFYSEEDFSDMPTDDRTALLKAIHASTTPRKFKPVLFENLMCLQDFLS